MAAWWTPIGIRLPFYTGFVKNIQIRSYYGAKSNCCLNANYAFAIHA